MSSDIEFGDVRHAEPKRGIRPDQDAHFHVVPVGTPRKKKQDVASDSESGELPHIHDPDNLLRDVPDDDLLIFVDIDVMRDMEAHAQSNTRVELGGVMLGYQKVDHDGRPFVVVTDSLRAEHYEATKGSFKFTHDTWSQITDQRSDFHPELEMVGWYHTHPGWSVFLSGMDLFICNNFFNRPLDVALVIDPVAHERGWFQWENGDGRNVTRQTNQFLLMASRYRQDEVELFAKLYRDGPTMADPRYSQSSYGPSQPVVNIMDNRRPIVDIALIAMLTVLFVLLALLAWKVISPVAPVQSVADSDVNATATAREQAFEEVLQTIVNSATDGPKDVVKKYAELQQQQKRLLTSIDGQVSLIENIRREKQQLANDLEKETKLSNNLARQLTEANGKISELAAKQTSGADLGQDSLAAGEQGNNFWWWLAGGLVSTVIVGAIGFLFGHKRGKFDAYDELDGDKSPVSKNSMRTENPSNREDDSNVQGSSPNPTSINFSDD